MNKMSFKSRGYRYHLCDAVTFGDLHFGSEAGTMTEEYMTDCLNAHGVGIVERGDDFYFYLSPRTTQDNLLQEVILHYAENWGEDIFCEALRACMIITENLIELATQRTKLKAQLI